MNTQYSFNFLQKEVYTSYTRLDFFYYYIRFISNEAHLYFYLFEFICFFLCEATEKITKSSHKISKECLQAKELLCPPKGGVRDRNKAINILKDAVKKGDANAKSMLGRLLLDFCYNTYDPKLGRELLIAAKEQGVSDNSILLDIELYPLDAFSMKMRALIYFYHFTSRYNNNHGMLISPNKKNSKLDSFYKDELTMLYDYSELRTMSEYEDKLISLVEKGDYNALILLQFRNYQLLYEEFRVYWGQRLSEVDKAYVIKNFVEEVMSYVKIDADSEFINKFENSTKKLEIAHHAGYENASFVLAHMYYSLLISFNLKDEEKLLEYNQKVYTYYIAAANQSVSYSSFCLLRHCVPKALESNILPISDEIVKNGIKEAEVLGKEDWCEAHRILGTMYLWGIYVKKDVKKGLQYLEKSADDGDVNVFYYLEQYYSGRELGGKQNEPIDPEKARYYKSMNNALMD